MNKTTISVEEIRSNPDLDLSERIIEFQNKGYGSEDAEDLAVATIKAEYEYWANNRTNVSDRTDQFLKKILNGHHLDKYEGFEMICDDPEKVALYTEYEELKDRISKANGITEEDFDKLSVTFGFDPEQAIFIKESFRQRGQIVDSYENDDTRHK